MLTTKIISTLQLMMQADTAASAAGPKEKKSDARPSQSVRALQTSGFASRLGELLDVKTLKKSLLAVNSQVGGSAGGVASEAIEMRHKNATMAIHDFGETRAMFREIAEAGELPETKDYLVRTEFDPSRKVYGTEVESWLGENAERVAKFFLDSVNVPTRQREMENPWRLLVLVNKDSPELLLPPDDAADSPELWSLKKALLFKVGKNRLSSEMMWAHDATQPPENLKELFEQSEPFRAFMEDLVTYFTAAITDYTDPTIDFNDARLNRFHSFFYDRNVTPYFGHRHVNIRFASFLWRNLILPVCRADSGTKEKVRRRLLTTTIAPMRVRDQGVVRAIVDEVLLETDQAARIRTEMVREVKEGWGPDRVTWDRFARLFFKYCTCVHPRQPCRTCGV